MNEILKVLNRVELKSEVVEFASIDDLKKAKKDLENVSVNFDKTIRVANTILSEVKAAAKISNSVDKLHKESKEAQNKASSVASDVKKSLKELGLSVADVTELEEIRTLKSELLTKEMELQDIDSKIRKVFK